MRRFLIMLLLCLSPPLAAEPSLWTERPARELLAAIDSAAAHGLDPEDYGRARLALALAAPDPAQVAGHAAAGFRALATDLAGGRVSRSARAGWHMEGQPMTPARLDALERDALAGTGVAAVLEGLLPPYPQYRALARRYAATPADETATRDLLRVNLERWRWMPRHPGPSHLLVNVAAQELIHLREGMEPVRHRVIVGRPRTPTLQFSALATGVVLNPPWVVPQSIIRESVGALIRTSPAAARARGFSWTGSGAGLVVTQAPGPNNALGEVKIDMPNPHGMFLHDTPNRALFARRERALSHGCIRTEGIRALAARMLEGTPGWDPARIDAVIATRRTTVVPLARPLPAHIGYFAAEALPDGRLLRHADIYGRDAAILAALGGGTAPDRPASRDGESGCG